MSGMGLLVPGLQLILDVLSRYAKTEIECSLGSGILYWAPTQNLLRYKAAVLR